MERFVEWLRSEIKTRGISQADLAKDSGLSASTISRILDGTVKPGDNTISNIAKALGEPAEKIFRLAGRLPQTPEVNSLEEDLLHIFRQLSTEQQKFILDMLRGLQGQLAVKLVAVPSEIEVPPRPPGPVPDSQEIMEVVESLDEFERWLVYDMARWRLAEQARRRDSAGNPKPNQLSYVEILRAMETMTPTQRRWLVERTIEGDGD